MKKYTLPFNEIKLSDINLVGGKNASLGEMIQFMLPKGINVPNGFAVTVEAYDEFILSNGLDTKIREEIEKCDINDIKSLSKTGMIIRQMIVSAEFPKHIADIICEEYHKLSAQYNQENTDVAVRSSATAEDLPDASFAGQQETYLNVRNANDVLTCVRKCWASLFTDRAISYRSHFNYDHFEVKLSVGIQKMVRTDLAVSGVSFSIDTESGFKDVVLINSSYGLGELIVQGAVSPDEFLVFKPTLKDGYNAIIEKKMGTKDIKMIYDTSSDKRVKTIHVDKENQKKFSLKKENILQIAKWVTQIEEYYSNLKGHWCPMDVEWGIDGLTNQLFILQARPETIHSTKKFGEFKMISEFKLEEGEKKVLAKGIAVGNKVATGKVKVLYSLDGRDGTMDGQDFKEGDVLVTEMTDPDWEPLMKKASAIITDRGGRTCFDGDTKILTNDGFKTIKEIYESDEKYEVPSLNRDTLKIEWKPIVDKMKKESKLIQIETTLTNKAKGDYLKLTPDHKMITYENGEICDKKINDIINEEQMLVCADKIPILKNNKLNNNLGFLLGAIGTDGCIHIRKNHGEVSFIQKKIEKKLEFIDHVSTCFNDVYDYDLKEQIRKETNGYYIRGKEIIGQANAYRCYNKHIVQNIKLEQDNLSQTILNSGEEFIYSFLAGVIDGDGTYNNNRISIYCSKRYLFEAIIISCLRLNIFPQVTNNLHIWNIQIVEKLDKILQYTKRIKWNDNIKIKENNKLYSARQILGPNFRSKFSRCLDKNLLISSDKLKYLEKSKISKDYLNKVTKIINSDTRMKRVKYIKDLDISEVYNITVEDNHNYIVFSEKYTPILVNNCHAAIIAREMGIPAIVGTINGSELLNTDTEVTVSCAEGDVGFIYEGYIKYTETQTDLTELPQTKTPIMLNVGSPEVAFNFASYPQKGVGLARLEFIMNNYIQVHPMALLKHKELNDSELTEKIENLIKGYDNEEDYFIKKVAYGIAKIGSAYYPNKVIVRFSDFKSNEYYNMLGGKYFEPHEENPMIGWRGASRYYSPAYIEAFKMECKAIKFVREKIGLRNVIVMIPFCRTIDEIKKVTAIMNECGLYRGENKKDALEVYLMAEIPSNIILAEQFCEYIDGFSIGSNDLTQLTLGLDRDSSLVAHVYDERNDAVKMMISQLIKTAKRMGKKVGICGQGPSDFPDFAQFLVQERIDSISVTPDSFLKTSKAIYDIEIEIENSKENWGKGPFKIGLDLTKKPL